MIFQSPFASLNPRWNVGDIIAEPMTVLAVLSDRTSINKRVDELLELVGLSAADADKFPHEFSGEGNASASRLPGRYPLTPSSLFAMNQRQHWMFQFRRKY